MEELDLERQLLNITSPELTRLYLNALDLFDSIGVTTHIDTIEQAMGIHEYQSGNEFQNMLRDTIERQLTYELGKFTIVLNPDVPYDIGFCTELLRGMYHIDNYPDGDAMLDVLQTDEDTRESLYGVLKLINPIDEDEFFIQVTDVNPALITRLRSTKEALPDTVTEEVERLRGLIKERTLRARDALIGYYTPFYETIDSDALNFIETVPLGFDLAPTVALLIPRIVSQETKEIIADLALLCTASNITDPLSAFNILIDLYLPDAALPRVIQTVTEVRAILEMVKETPVE